MTPEQLIDLTNKYDSNLMKVESADNGDEMKNLIEMFWDLPGVKFDTSNEKLHFLRELVAMQLKSACKDFLEMGLTPEIVFTYRPISTQKGLFQKRVTKTKEENPNLDSTNLLSLANMFSAGIPKLAAHTQGAAVDILLWDKDGNLLDFGIEYPAGSELSHTNSTKISPEAKQNRNILVGTMTKHGFVNYPFEYWHFSLGDTDYAYQNNQKTTMYLPIDYDPNTKKFIPFTGNPNVFFDVII